MGFWAIYRRTFRLLGQDRRLAYGLLSANALLVAAILAEPILFGRIVDALTQANDSQYNIWQTVTPLLVLWVVIGLFAIFCAAMIALLSDRMAHRCRHVVLRDYFEHVLQLPFHHQQSQHSGRLIKIMLQGTDALWALWLGFFRDHFAALIAIVVLMPVAFYLNAMMASLLFALCVLFAWLAHFVLRKTDALQQAVESHYTDMAEHVADTLGNVGLIQSFSRVRHEVDTLRLLSQKVVGAQFPALSWWALVNVLTRSATTFTVLAMLILGLWLFSQQRITIGEIVMFIGFSGLVIGRLEQSVSFANRLSVEAPKLREFFSVLEAEPEITELDGAIDPGELTGALEFARVSYRYRPGASWAVKDFSLVVEPGRSVALVGPSGAGKSTTLSLLCRFFDPLEGHLYADGYDIKKFQIDAFRRNIGVVFQESLLFNRSVEDNLRIGKPDASLEDLRQAAQDASALGFIEALPQGFATVIGERGKYLSGGQRQRLAIARVLLKDPAILVLDEATSALDVQTEVAVQLAMAKARQGRTTLLIAHRLSTIEHADVIVYMEHGRVMEMGRFDELIQKKGLFAQMVKSQFQYQVEQS
jgi:ATP-binding cassette subfamily B protein